MKFRYVKEYMSFLPQYLGKDDKWCFFEIDNFNINSNLLVGIQGFMNYLGRNVKKRENLFILRKEVKILAFLDELDVCAFLGAANYWFKIDKIEFNIESNEQKAIN